MINFNSFRAFQGRAAGFLKGEGKWVLGSLCGVLLSLVSLGVGLSGFRFLYQPSQISITCPEGYQEDIRQARDLIQDMTKP